MRLLKADGNGGYSLTEFFDDDIPPYAILSHTWGSDDDELTFKDMKKGRKKDRPGYAKIIFCAKRAAVHGLEYFWIDTCCIDKSSSAELSEAINSMFRWYQNAAICYVYLTDVFSRDPTWTMIREASEWKIDFQTSRWFTRGWTLQELIAPRLVGFYSQEGDFLGDKISLLHDIQHISQISAFALQGHGLGCFSREDRMNWALGRKTKRGEDAAYSLLGLFGIHMPLIYGEGKAKALERLEKKINKMEKKYSLLQAAISKGDHFEAERLLLDGLDVRTPNKQAFDILKFAVVSNDRNTVDLLLRFGLDPCQEVLGENGLSVAHDHDHFGIQDTMFRQTISQSRLKDPTIFLAVYNGDLVKLLEYHHHTQRERPICYNETDASGATALYWSALRGHLHVTDFLLQHRARLDKQTRIRRTALHEAAKHNHRAIQKLLLQYGADPHLPDALGKDSWYWMSKNGSIATPDANSQRTLIPPVAPPMTSTVPASEKQTGEKMSDMSMNLVKYYGSPAYYESLKNNTIYST